VRSVAERVEALPFVEEVQYGEDWLDGVYVLRRAAGVATLTLGIGFAAVAALIIGAAIRMAVFARRDEIIIMRLVGATDAFIRRPFIIEGLLTGLLGAVLAVAATWALFGSCPGRSSSSTGSRPYGSALASPPAPPSACWPAWWPCAATSGRSRDDGGASAAHRPPPGDYRRRSG
jgi:cell division protein FtsX